MNDSTTIILVLVNLVAGFLTWLFLKEYFHRFRWWKAAIIKSLVYSLFFGIGALGEGGGEPGFILPVPVLPAAVISLPESGFDLFARNALLPFIFWASVLFAFYCLRQVFRPLKEIKAS